MGSNDSSNSSSIFTAGDVPSLRSSTQGQIHVERLMSVIENYLRYYAQGDSHTAKAKRYDLQHFLLFVAGSRNKVETVTIADWTYERTQAFVDDRIRIGESPATVSRRLATIKHFGRTLAERVPGYINPAREVKGPQQRATRPKGLEPEELAALSSVSEPTTLDDFTNLRNCLLLQLLLETGLRADEVRLLTRQQVSDDLCWLKNVRTKGRKFRNVYINTKLRNLLETYLKLRQQQVVKHLPDVDQNYLTRAPLIVSFRAAHPADASSLGLAPKTVWRIIRAFGNKAQQQINDNLGSLHPHRLRHTFALGLLNSSKDVRLVAQALGHSDVRTTMRYTERTEEEIAKAIESSLGEKK
ncbi:tyrosine-type recombinase/integrase [bacterium]|nr:tyrosine-type recombinase/integrase [bacterium]